MTYTGKKTFLDRCPRCCEYREKGTVRGQRDVLGRIACKPCREQTEVEVQNEADNGATQGQEANAVPGDEPTEQAGD